MDLVMSDACPLSADAKYVAVHLINRSKPDDERAGWNKAWPASSTIARATSLKLRAVEQAISDLRRLGGTCPVEITVERRYRPGRGGRDSNMYRFRLPAAGADKLDDLTRNGRGHDVGAYPQKNGGIPAETGGSIPAAGAEESPKKESPKESPKGAHTPSRKKTERRKPETPIPDDFAPDETVFEMARTDLRFDRSRVMGELAKFKDHAAANDRRAREWMAAFRNWLRNAPDFQKPQRTTNGVQAVQQSSGWRQRKMIALEAEAAAKRAAL